MNLLTILCIEKINVIYCVNINSKKIFKAMLLSH